ncbi:MAG: hypothetical protein K6F37_06400 [Lachnospiraceae bacterium]|nr:hypothetical protein [Lachnospiraceae bacterium]
MNWYPNLYVGESIKGKEKKIRRKIDLNAGMINVHVITLAKNRVDLFDIIPAWEIKLMRKHFNDLPIVGLAGDFDEAVEMSGNIVMELYNQTGRLDTRNIIEENWN